jgi:hypothetical protein
LIEVIQFICLLQSIKGEHQSFMIVSLPCFQSPTVIESNHWYHCP